MPTLNENDSGTLAASAQSNTVGPCKAINYSFSGTWAGTIAVQRYFGGAWETVESFTGNAVGVLQVGVRAVQVRLDWTRVSGSLVYVIEGDDGTSAAVAGNVTLQVGDVEIGAVEIKDGAADIRQTVLAASTAAGATDKAAVVGFSPNSPLPAGTALIGKVDHPTTGFGDGVKTVTSAGTDEALAGSTTAKWVIIQAQTDNTSIVAIGATGVDATVATGDGIVLAAGDVVTIPCDNLADIFVDALVSGEGVRYAYGT